MGLDAACLRAQGHARADDGSAPHIRRHASSSAGASCASCERRGAAARSVGCAPEHLGEHAAGAPLGCGCAGAQFTCFTGTKGLSLLALLRAGHLSAVAVQLVTLINEQVACDGGAALSKKMHLYGLLGRSLVAHPPQLEVS